MRGCGHQLTLREQGIYATSRHIPGVRFAGIPHPGLIGTMPSQALLDTWNKREGALIEKHGSDCVPAVALPPEPKGAYIGQELKDAVRDKIHREGCRTIPGREHGGNCDIKNLSRGSRCFFPVFVEGAGLSLGDLHFSQGDGELSFCGAIEMAGITTLKVDIIKGGVEKFAMTMPVSAGAALSDTPTHHACPFAITDLPALANRPHVCGESEWCFLHCESAVPQLTLGKLPCHPTARL